MKRLILLLLFILSAHCGYSQFLLTPEGFINESDESKNYVVLNFDGKNKEDLFKQAKNTITSYYNSPKDVLSESFPDMLSVSGYAPIKFNFGGMYGRAEADLYYKITMSFKDEKVKIDFDILNLTHTQQDGQTRKIPIKTGVNGSTYGVYKKNGDLRDADAKKAIEQIPNRFIEIYSSYGDQEKQDDW